MKGFKKVTAVFCAVALAGSLLTGCAGDEQKRIVRIGHNQSTNHPTHIALTAFQTFVNEKLGDKYVVEVYPSELLGSQTDMVQLTQTAPLTSALPAMLFWKPSVKTMKFLIFPICLPVRRPITMLWMILRLRIRFLNPPRRLDLRQ